MSNDDLRGGDRNLTIGTSVTNSAVVAGDGNTVTVTVSNTTIIPGNEVKTRELNTASPYKGLKRFEAKDRTRFFGREQFLNKLAKELELEQTNCILLLGASGSGKSSIIRAGLIPWLEKQKGDDFESFIFTPDSNPFESLYRSLSSRFQQSKAEIARAKADDTLIQVVNQLKPPNSYWLFFIDQFEELFTMSDPKTCGCFIDSLVKLGQTSLPLVKIVATMRADFLDRLSSYPNLVTLTDSHRPLLAAMQADELRMAIEQPSAHHGVVFEDGLVEEIIKNVQGQAGCLPLLQYTLDLLWKSEVEDGGIHDRTLNTTSYRQLGGVRGALQQRVDEIYTNLSEPGKLAAQRLFLKLVEIGDDAESGTEWKPVRRRAKRSEFSDQTEAEVLVQLIDANLLVSDAAIDGATVEISHEILLTSWDNLHEWIQENRQAIALRNRLYDDVRLWLKEEKRDADLWNGERLKRVNDLRANTTFEKALGGFHQEAIAFIEASNALGKRQMQERIAADDDRRTAIMNLLEACTVKLVISDQDGASTGFFVARGKILTCAPKILKAERQSIKVTWQDQGTLSVKEATATIDRLFQSANLAILKLTDEANHPCVYLDTNFEVDDPLCSYGYSSQVVKDGYGHGKCQKRTGKDRRIIEFTTYQNSLELQSSPLLNLKTLNVCGIVQSTHEQVRDVLDQDRMTVGKAISAAAILATIDGLKKEQKTFHNSDPRWSELLPSRCKPRTVALVSVGITGLIVAARFLKLLQPLELGFYDHLIRSQFDSKPSNQVLVIEAIDQDIADQIAEGKKGEAVIGSFSNTTLLKVLEKANQLKPIAVGLDIYRDNAPLDRRQDQSLKKLEAEGFNLFTVCKSPATNGEVAPPPYARPDRVAFSDKVSDGDGVLRRYTLAYNASKNAQTTSKSTCTTNFSLALLLANQYLKTQHGIELKNLKEKNQSPFATTEYCLKFTDSQNHEVIFPNFQKYMGGYQNVQHNTKCQVLINYQRRALVNYSSTSQDNAEAVALKDFLSDRFPREKYEDRIILIGSTSYNTIKDYWNTPYTSSAGENMPGVEIQAQVVNQIINAVLPNTGGRPQIWVLPQWQGIQWGEFFWIWAGALAGGFAVRWWRSPKGSVIAIVVTCASGYIICFAVFQLSGGWLPFIPVVGVLMLTGTIIYWLNWRSASRKLVESSKPHSQS